MVTAATIYLSLMGSEGLRRTAAPCNAPTASLVRQLADLDGISLAFDTFFHEGVLTFERPVAPLLKILAEQDIFGGFDLSASYPELGNSLLVCATEVRTTAEIDNYVAVMKAVMQESEAA